MIGTVSEGESVVGWPSSRKLKPAFIPIHCSDLSSARRDVLDSVEADNIIANNTSPRAAMIIGDAKIGIIWDGNGKPQKCRQHEQHKPSHAAAVRSKVLGSV